MKKHTFYSIRHGLNKNKDGFSLEDFKNLFVKVFDSLIIDGYFDENFGFWCIDNHHIEGNIKDIELEILLKIRKKNLWPIKNNIQNYTEDDLFDIIEFLYFYISKPIEGKYHDYGDCGMHWETFNKVEGQKEFIQKINDIFDMYEGKFELSYSGEVLSKPEAGFENIFNADVPTKDENVSERVNSAILQYRRHGSTLDDRRQSVRDLADILEYLRPKVKNILTSQDEKDLFNLANNFGVRHHNDKQKTNYDKSLWLSWMFYYYLSTIHVLLRKIKLDKT